MNLPMHQSGSGQQPGGGRDRGPEFGDVCFSTTSAPPGSVARRRREALVRTIEDQIVPRLLVARTPPDMCAPVGEAAYPLPTQEVLDLVALTLGQDADAVRHRVLETAGRMSLEALCLNLLQPAARQLGDLWMEDLASFTDVTIGMMRLHEGLNAVTGMVRETPPETRRRHRILLAPAPGDDHRFGLAMVGAFFGQAGWMVTTAHDEDVNGLADLLRRDWFGVLGFSVSAEIHVERLTKAVPILRRASRNEALAVLVGGPVFAQRPELVRAVGADATAADGVQATWVAENMLAGRPPYS